MYLKNDYEICGDLTKIFVINKRNQKFEVFIDTDELTNILNAATSIFVATWDATPYAILQHKETKKGIKLHRFLMNPASHLVIDHLNHCGLDNRKKNLKICTQAENAARSKGYRADWSHHPLKGVNIDARH